MQNGREPISEALMDELSMSGLDAEGNPNERGVLLDELMGAFAWDDPNHPLPGFRPRADTLQPTRCSDWPIRRRSVRGCGLLVAYEKSKDGSPVRKRGATPSGNRQPTQGTSATHAG